MKIFLHFKENNKMSDTKNNNILYKIFTIIFSLCFVIAFDEYLLADNTLGHESIFNLLILFFCMLIFNRTKSVKFKSNKYYYILSFLMAFSIIVGGEIYHNDTISGIFKSGKNFMISIISFIGITVVFGRTLILVFNYIDTRTKHADASNQWKIYKHPIIFWPIIFVCFLPCFLAYFPGLLSYDAVNQTQQVIGIISVSKFHPPLHTFIWWLCVNLEEIIGIYGSSLCVYAIVQMIVFSGSLAYIVKFLIQRKVNNWIIMLSIIYLALNPTFAIFSVSMTKDIYFASFFIFYTIELIKMICQKSAYFDSKINIVRFILVSVICCLFRNNMIYVYVLAGFIIFFALKGCRKKLLLIEVGSIFLFFLIYQGLYTILNVQPGESKEKLSIPMMQMARVMVYHGDEIDQTVYNEIKPFFVKEPSPETADFEDMDEYFYTKFADGIKNRLFNTEYYDDNKSVFWKNWWTLCKEYPLEYLDEFLDLNCMSWYIDVNSTNMRSNSESISTKMETLNFIEIDENGETQLVSWEVISRNSKLPGLLKYYDKFATYEPVVDIPLVNNIFSEATPIWVILLSITICLVRKKKKLILALLPSLLLWMTYLLGPVVAIRYMLPFVCLYPLYISICFQPDSFCENKIE
jgi:hypothetical protein